MVKPTKAEVKKLVKRKKALGYALSLTAFQDVGMVEYDFLGDVREIVFKIQDLCKRETGYELESYPIEFLKTNAKEIKEHYPHLKNFI